MSPFRKLPKDSLLRYSRNMPRLKNVLNDKDRKAQVVQTSETVTYKLPLEKEETKLGHFISQEIIDKTLVIRFATRKENDIPNLKIEHRPEFTVSFN
jgi:hypothetical protein